jgi:hypothetical protein
MSLVIARDLFFQNVQPFSAVWSFSPLLVSASSIQADFPNPFVSFP